jgi:hypothetical protein
MIKKLEIIKKFFEKFFFYFLFNIEFESPCPLTIPFPELEFKNEVDEGLYLCLPLLELCTIKNSFELCTP